MPVFVAVGAAVAATAIAAVEVTTFTIIAAVGAVVGAVGAITGNKALSIAGMAIGAVGGIGSLAEAGALGSDAQSFVSGIGGGSGSAAATGTAEAVPGSEAAQTATAQGAQSSLINPAQEAQAGGSPTSLINMNSSSLPPGNMSTSAIDNQIATGTIDHITGGTSLPGDAPSFAPDSTPLTGSSEGVPMAGSAAPPNAYGMGSSTPPVSGSEVATPPGTTTGGAAGATGAGAAPDGSLYTDVGDLIEHGPIDIPQEPSTWGNIMKFLGKNSNLTFGALMAGSSFLSGATNPKTPADIELEKAQANLYNQQANLLGFRMNNMQQGIPTSSFLQPLGTAHV